MTRPRTGAARTWRRLRGESSGQALVEFAIVAPLMVMILLFSIWFYELVQIKLKVQEATRFAAWESTGYKLHDYDKGQAALSQLAMQMQTRVMADTMLRYANLDSTNILPTHFRTFSASWTPPFVIVSNQQEEQVPGGPIVNMIFGIGGFLFDLISGLLYGNQNWIAASLVGVGKDMGNARMTRVFGNASWGFNKNGYVCSNLMLMVTNQWFNRGVGSMVLPNTGVFLRENPRGTFDHCVLADSWRLHDGSDVVGSSKRPGVSKNSAYYKQVKRMFFMNNKAHNLARTYVNLFKSGMQLALGFNPSMASSGMSNEDFFQATLVSKNFKDAKSGQVQINEDESGSNNGKYDTAPLDSGKKGKEINTYAKTLEARGEYFMGCKTQMQLGCPSSTLQQDNPFGGYIIRDTGGGSSK